MNDFTAPPGSLCAFTYYLVHAAQDVESRVEHALAEVGLSLAKVKLLRHLHGSKDAIPLGALAEKNSCVKSNVTQLMDRMEAEGLVRRLVWTSQSSTQCLSPSRRYRARVRRP